MAKRKFLEIHHGTTRTVFLVGKYAIKIPLIKKYYGKEMENNDEPKSI